jgi:hypothetical protein
MRDANRTMPTIIGHTRRVLLLDFDVEDVSIGVERPWKLWLPSVASASRCAAARLTACRISADWEEIATDCVPIETERVDIET